jgi:hypothetical protein
MPEHRGEIKNMTDIFRGSIVDIGPNAVIIQLTGTEEKIESFIELCRPYGIQQLSRTGVIAIQRASQVESKPPRVRPLRRRSATTPLPIGVENLPGFHPMLAPMAADEQTIALPPS